MLWLFLLKFFVFLLKTFNNEILWQEQNDIQNVGYFVSDVT